MTDDTVASARAGYEAYFSKDRAALEALIAPDLHFTSPLDNRIDRATYFARCWPNSERVADFKFVRLVRDAIKSSSPMRCAAGAAVCSAIPKW